ncbi:hypothetical protein Salat_2104400 [Sesamum alatum]|uniref:Uncharacterized protein n=1 Tax=Sesamum alatum TaxID=300844 RepID=A0AAE1Y0L6_9LAMI|nr:hypothetical protein Salat_2104400 [Sesamum alatum]
MASNGWTRFHAQFNAAPFTATLDIFFAFPTHSFPAVFTMASHLVDLFHHRYTDVFHRGVSFVIPVLVALLQLKYQGNQETPFATHPKTMGVAVSTCLLYYLAYNAQLQPCIRRFSPACVGVLRHCMVVFGDLSVASMASVFFADSVRPFLYVLFLLLPAGELLYWVYLRLFVEGSEELEVDIRQIRWFLINLCWITA